MMTADLREVRPDFSVIVSAPRHLKSVEEIAIWLTETVVDWVRFVAREGLGQHWIDGTLPLLAAETAKAIQRLDAEGVAA